MLVLFTEGRKWDCVSVLSLEDGENTQSIEVLSDYRKGSKGNILVFCQNTRKYGKLLVHILRHIIAFHV